jgi:MFS superfamily sulfate permease-like transporter
VELLGRLSQPSVTELARDPATDAWGSRERHPSWRTVPGVYAAGVEGPLFYANSEGVKRALLDAVRGADGRPDVLVLDLSRNDEIDVQALDMLDELATELAAQGIELRLAAVHVPVLALLQTAGVAARVRIEPTLEAALS